MTFLRITIYEKDYNAATANEVDVMKITTFASYRMIDFGYVKRLLLFSV